MIPTLTLDKFLEEQGYQGQLQEALYNYLEDLGFTGPLNEKMYKWLKALGYEGTLPDKIHQWVKEGGGEPVLPPEPAPIDSVVIIGASIMNSMFGKDLATPHATATSLLAAKGINIPVYGYATAGAYLSRAITHYKEARAAHPNALIVMHFGGNNVSSERPYPGGLTSMNSSFAALLAEAGNDPRFFPASISFRDYDDATFQDPSLGAKPYNENILIPWIAANYPHAMASYGRPKLDFYRRSLQSYETWLSGDNIHLTSTGNTEFRAWIMERVADILSGNVISEIPERTATPTAPVITTQPGISGGTREDDTLTLSVGAASGVPSPTPAVQWYLDGALQNGETGMTFDRPAGVGKVPSATVIWSNGTLPNASATATAPATTAASATPAGPLSIVNFKAPAHADVGHNNIAVGGTASTISLASILDTTGQVTGMSMAVTAAHNMASNTQGRATAPAYAGQLLTAEITRSSVFVDLNRTVSIEVSGATANAEYGIGIVGSRAATDVRQTELIVQGTSVVWNACEDPAQEHQVVVAASADGKIAMTLKQGPGSSYGYLGGLSFKRLA